MYVLRKGLACGTGERTDGCAQRERRPGLYKAMAEERPAVGGRCEGAWRRVGGRVGRPAVPPGGQVWMSFKAAAVLWGSGKVVRRHSSACYDGVFCGYFVGATLASRAKP